MKPQSLVVAALLVGVPALAAAQANSFRSIDRNGDGFISSEEWYGQNVAPVPFTMVDLNGDGRISESEFREWSSARGGAGVMGITSADRFRAIDRNKDGVISAEEWKNGLLALTPFSAVDANKDGKITQREFTVWDQNRGGPVAAAPPPPPGVAAPTLNERLQGAAGVSGPAGIVGPTGVSPSVVQPTPPVPSSMMPEPPSAVTTVPERARIPGSSPNISSGSSFAR